MPAPGVGNHAELEVTVGDVHASGTCSASAETDGIKVERITAHGRCTKQRRGITGIRILGDLGIRDRSTREIAVVDRRRQKPARN